MIYIMHKDTPVVELSTFTILDKQLAPHHLVGLGKDFNKFTVQKWLSNRAVPLNRKNADKLYQSAGLSRQNMAVELMFITHALSINDNYWICKESELGKLRWNNINLYNNHLSNSLSYLAFTGDGPISICNELSAEYTGQGTYAKCFRRGKTGLEICKKGTSDEISAEIISSFICQVLGIPHVNYWYEVVYGMDACISTIATNENVSWESAFNFTIFSEREHSKNVYDYAFCKYPINMYSMILVDGLLLNEDRHLQNWMIQSDGNTNVESGIAPLYDFNKSFTGNTKSMSQFIPGKNILAAAREAQDILQLDLINTIMPVVKYIPEKWREAFINRIYYICRIRGNQRDCY